MNKKNTKRSLGLSLLCLLLCTAMLIGSTFAWFTDTATTSVNTIQSGTLDIDIVDEKDVSLEGKTLNFTNVNGSAEILWEPGARFNLQQATLINKGNLHAKYQVVISGINGDSKLANVLDVYEGETNLGTLSNLVAKGGIVNSGVIEPNGTRAFGQISLKMQETAGNEYQNLFLKNIAITVMATQATVEFDSFNNTYDDGALNANPITGEVVDLTGKTLTNSGYDAVILADGKAMTISGDGVVHAVEEDEYAMAVWAKNEANVTIKSGTFTNAATGDDGYSLIYASGNSTITIEGGIFQCVTPKWTLNCKDGEGTIIVKGGRFYKFDPSAVYTEPTQPMSFVAEGYKVTQDGDWYIVTKAEAIVETPATAEDLNKLLQEAVDGSGTDVVITLNKNFEIDTWESFSPKGYSGVSSVTINGNGHTIKGLNAPLVVGSFAGNGKITINDLTIEGAKISAAKKNLGLGAFVAYSDASGGIVLNNCKLVNSTVECTDGYAGGLVGYSSSPVSVTGCTVTGSTIKGGNSSGAIAGQFAAPATVTNCTVTGTAISYCHGDEVNTDSWRVGVIVGTANVGTVTMNDITEFGNTLAQGTVTAPEHSNLYGRSLGGGITLDDNAI